MSSQERVLILYDVLYHGTSSNKEVTERTGVNKGLVSIYLNMLVDRGILTKERRTYKVMDSAIVRSIKRMLNLAKISMDELDTSWARGIGIYGSWAEGSNSVESDVDVWALVDEMDSHRIAQFRKALSDMTLSEVNILTLTIDRIERLKEQNSLFYKKLVCDSVVLVGEIIR